MFQKHQWLGDSSSQTQMQNPGELHNNINNQFCMTIDIKSFFKFEFIEINILNRYFKEMYTDCLIEKSDTKELQIFKV